MSPEIQLHMVLYGRHKEAAKVQVPVDPIKAPLFEVLLRLLKYLHYKYFGFII